MKIGFAGDHSSVDLKDELISLAKSLGYEAVDYGTNSKESCDYPVYGKKLSKAVLKKEVDLGVAICGTGIGISIACNKVRGIRAALCKDTFSARAAREHNDANILCLGARTTGLEIAKDIFVNFMEAEFQGGRHQRRIDLLEE